jgi:hypothetical protein
VLAYHLLAKQASDNAPWMAVLASKKRGSDAVEKVHRVVGAPFLKVLLAKNVCSILSPFSQRTRQILGKRISMRFRQNSLKIVGAPSSFEDSVAKKFKLIRNKHILKYLRVKRVERVLLFFCKIYSRRFYTFYFDELKFFCNTTGRRALGTSASLRYNNT